MYAVRAGEKGEEMKSYDVQQRNILQLRKERDDARRWSAAWKAAARDRRLFAALYSNHLHEAEEDNIHLAIQVEALRGVCEQFVVAYDQESHTLGDNMLEDAAQMARETLADLREESDA